MLMKKNILICFLVLISISYSRDNIVTTCKPVYLVLNEICGLRINIENIVPDSLEPGNYSPNTLQAFRINSAAAFIFLHDSIETWAANVNPSVKLSVISLLDSMPDEFGLTDTLDEDDVFFWFNPLAAAEFAAVISDTLSKIFPDEADRIKSNTISFKAKCKIMAVRTLNILGEKQDRPVNILGSGLDYFTRGFGLMTVNYPDLDSLVESDIFKSEFKPIQYLVTGRFTQNENIDLKERLGANILQIKPFGNYPDINKYSDLVLYVGRIFALAM